MIKDMGTPSLMCGRARRHLHRKSLVVGSLLVAILIFIIALAVAFAGSDRGAAALFVLSLTWVVWVVGLVLLLVGVTSEMRARRINRDDWATANSLAAHAQQLLARAATEAYSSDAVMRLDTHRVLEVERHFDEKTAGEARGTLAHQFSMFGQSFGLGYAANNRTSVAAGVHSAAINGMSDVLLRLSSTTRHDLMGDALFALFEVHDASGQPDTLRVTALSNGAVTEWIHALVLQTAEQLGMDTHSGVTVEAYASRIADHFAPADVSYLSDRLRLALAQIERGEEPPSIYVEGVPSGRGAIVATSARVGEADALRIFPTALPAMWGHTVGGALAAAVPPKEISA